MSRNATAPKKPRHKLAIDTARFQALRAANVEARTTFTHAEQGKDDPTFRRVYVQVFARTYNTVIHDRA
jgi:hypothetical protein